MIDTLHQFLQQNQVASGGLVVVFMSSLLYVLRRLPKQLLILAQRRFVYTIEILDDDESFDWVCRWLGMHEYSRYGRRMSLRTRPASRGPIAVSPQKLGKVSKKKDAEDPTQYIPGPGWHLLREHGAWFVVVRTRNTQQAVMSSGPGYKRTESFAIHTLVWNKEAANRLIRRAYELVHPPENRTVSIYTGSYIWQLNAVVPARDIRTVFLAENAERDILADAKNFLARREWYVERGLPYRRGYLLHGPPGNGKTSLILAIASELGANVGLFSFTDMELNDTSLLTRLSECAANNVIPVIEDIDVLFREQRKSDAVQTRVTFSGLINALDGVASPQGHLIFMTTNFRDKLDPALIRPGRVDVSVLVDNASASQIRRMASSIVGVRLAADETSVVDALCEKQISMAEAQQELVQLATKRLSCPSYDVVT